MKKYVYNILPHAFNILNNDPIAIICKKYQKEGRSKLKWHYVLLCYLLLTDIKIIQNIFL